MFHPPINIPPSTYYAVLLALVLGCGEDTAGGHYSRGQAPPLPPIGPVGMAIFAIPNLMRGRANAARTACFSNQRTIRTTIQQWATDKRKENSVSPSEDDIKDYFEGEKLPLCPAGGTYDLATVGDYPSCNKHGCYIGEEERE